MAKKDEWVQLSIGSGGLPVLVHQDSVEALTEAGAVPYVEPTDDVADDQVLDKAVTRADAKTPAATKEA